MERVFVRIDRLSVWVGKLFAWAIVIMTFAICYEVFMRYVIGRPTTWAYDAGYMLYGAIFMMAGAYALATQGHVRGDVLYRLFPTRMKASVDLVLYVLFFFPGIIALLYAGYFYAERAWIIGERSSASPAGPPLYHFKSLIPLAAFFLILQGLVETARCIFCIVKGYWPERYDDVKEVDLEAAKEYVGKVETQEIR